MPRRRRADLAHAGHQAFNRRLEQHNMYVHTDDATGSSDIMT